MSLEDHAVRMARAVTGRVVFRKRLPAHFGGARVYVTSRSDLRLLKPGWASAAGDLLHVAGRYIQPGACVWDLGSNLGIFTFCAAFKAGRSGWCHSLEPDPKYAEIQNRTAARLPDGYAPVSVLCAAIANEMAVLELAIPRKGHARNHLASLPSHSAGETESTKQVVSVTGSFLARFWKPPDFVKMDVEGAELLALQDSRFILEDARPVFYIEVSPGNQEPVNRIFQSHNYRLFRLASNGAEEPIEACDFNTLAKPAEQC